MSNVVNFPPHDTQSSEFERHFVRDHILDAIGYVRASCATGPNSIEAKAARGEAWAAKRAKAAVYGGPRTDKCPDISPGALTSATEADNKTASIEKGGEIEAAEAAEAASYHSLADHVLSINAANSDRFRVTVAYAALRSLPDQLAEAVVEADAGLRGAGLPIAAMDGVMAEAALWADMASSAELAAYALASFNRMSSAQQAVFLRHVGARGSA
jgi:hypothetical protein